MANHFRKSFDTPVPMRRLLVTEADIAAAQKLMQLLARIDELPEKEVRASGDAADASTARSQMVDQAAFAFTLRQRRLKVFGESFTAEAPFAMLLSLYVNENRQPHMSMRSLTKLSWLPYTTVVRWIEELERDGWIGRKLNANDRRLLKGGVRLTRKARAALDRLFSWTDEGADDEA